MERICILVITGLLLVGGCQRFEKPNRPVTPQMFEPTSMRIHPIFTQIRDWNGDGNYDGIEALIELRDGFDDPTKASGTVLFELFAYRPQHPDPRGGRLVNPWIGSLTTTAEQEAHWSGTTQTYNFQLAWPQVDPTRTYVLTATFETTDGKRFFDRTILTPVSRETDVGNPSTQSSETEPAGS